MTEQEREQQTRLWNGRVKRARLSKQVSGLDLDLLAEAEAQGLLSPEDAAFLRFVRQGS